MSYGEYQAQPPSGFGAAPGAVYASVGKRIIAHIIDSFIVGLGAIPGVILMIIGGGIAASTAGPSGQINDGAAAGLVGILLLGYALLFIGCVAKDPQPSGWGIAGGPANRSGRSGHPVALRIRADGNDFN